MRIVLIAMPWADATCPQASIGSLAAYLRQQRPDWEVEPVFAYLDVAGPDLAFYQTLAVADFEGERVYAALLHPEARQELASFWQRDIPEDSLLGRQLARRAARGMTPRRVLDDLMAALDTHLEDVVASRNWDNTVVGLTTSFSQLFANLVLARRIKSVAPSAVVVLGGATVSPAAMADSVLATYPFVDLIVRGEGELALCALCEHLESGGGLDAESLPRGVVSRRVPGDGGSLWQLDDLDALPMPDYDAYYQRVAPSAIGFLPVEGSRGCWWDRTARKATSTCQFCNLNIQWDGYRQKSARRIASEMRYLADRYRKTKFSFLDNIVRTRGFDELIDAIDELDLEPEIFHEARANLRPEQIVRFYEAGLRAVQFGLEGLSNRFLRRIHKGTTVVMNLEVMKTCAELGVRSLSNLIVAYPGSTAAEVAETVDTIDAFAFAYEPPNIAPFELGIDSVVARFPEESLVDNVRKHDRYRAIIPSHVLETLSTFQLSFDHVSTADWSPVIDRVARWKAEYRRDALTYEEGGTFLRVIRRRPQRAREVFELAGQDASIYRHCMRYRSRAELHRAFASGSGGGATEIDEFLARMVEQRLMYHHGDKYLSVAMARDSAVAIRRIKSQAIAKQREPARHRLAVVR